MVGVLVASHGLLAKELINSAAMLVGQADGLNSCCVLPGQSPEEFQAEAETSLQELNTGEGVIALVDIVGGTPCNTLYKLSRKYPVRIVAGVNLSMVMSACVERMDGMSADELVELFIENGKNEIMEFGHTQERN